MNEETQVQKCARIMAAAKRLGVLIRTYEKHDGFAYSFADPLGGSESMGPFRKTKQEALEAACDLWQKSIQMVE